MSVCGIFCGVGMLFRFFEPVAPWGLWLYCLIRLVSTGGAVLTVFFVALFVVCAGNVPPAVAALI